MAIDRLYSLYVVLFFNKVGCMGRPARLYRRRCMAGIDLTGYVPPYVACEWLRNALAGDSGGLSEQMDCKPWAVWLVWSYDVIDSKRVQLLCCVGERQALRIMDWAMRLDGYLMRLYESCTHGAVDVSDMVEWFPVMNGVRLDRPSCELWADDDGDESHIWMHRISRDKLRLILDRL